MIFKAYINTILWTALVVLAIGCLISCIEVDEQRTIAKAQVQVATEVGSHKIQGENITLDQIRKASKRKYKDVIEADRISTSRVKEQNYASSEDCKLCDIEFLVRISRRAELDRESFDYLICTLHGDCRNNVEFMEFYNEQLFEHINSQPQMFLERLEDEIDKNELIAHELSFPVSDRYSAEETMQTLMEVNKEFNNKFKSVPLLQQYMRLNK